jgi:transcriptional regulator with XRE-family HTH domain
MSKENGMARRPLFKPRTFARSIKATLKQQRLSMRDLAKELGCSVATISRVCAAKPPDVENYLRIEQWLSKARSAATPTKSATPLNPLSKEYHDYR